MQEVLGHTHNLETVDLLNPGVIHYNFSDVKHIIASQGGKNGKEPWQRTAGIPV